MLSIGNSDDEEPKFQTFNIMKNTRLDRISKVEEFNLTPRTPHQDKKDAYHNTGRRNESSAAKLRDFQRQKSIKRSPFPPFIETPRGNEKDLKDELYKIKHENDALNECIQNLESRLADETEQAEEAKKKNIKLIAKLQTEITSLKSLLQEVTHSYSLNGKYTINLPDLFLGEIYPQNDKHLWALEYS